jgi:hypothetical protein
MVIPRLAASTFVLVAILGLTYLNFALMAIFGLGASTFAE